MRIKVKAIRLGYYNNERKKPDTDSAIFMMDTDFLEKLSLNKRLNGRDTVKIGDDDYVVPSWIQIIDPKYKKAEPVLAEEDDSHSAELEYKPKKKASKSAPKDEEHEVI